jgi:alpha-glucosidase
MTAALPGALYVYQGEELGLEEYLDMPDEARQDPLFLGTNREQIGRDGCRVPLPWTADRSTNYGFSPSKVRPWLPQPDDWGGLSVEAQGGAPHSMLSFYREMMAARRQLSGAFEWVDIDLPECLAFTRGATLIVLNLGEADVDLPARLVDARTVALASQQDASTTRLPANSCAWLSP